MIGEDDGSVVRATNEEMDTPRHQLCGLIACRRRFGVGVTVCLGRLTRAPRLDLRTCMPLKEVRLSWDASSQLSEVGNQCSIIF